MEKIYHKAYGGWSYEIIDEDDYERYWWGKRPSSKEAFEEWLFDPHKTQHQMMKDHGKKNIGWNMRELIKQGIIRRFQREDADKSLKSRYRKRRSDLDISAEILYLANEGGVGKTVIVNQANLNFVIINRYLSNLLERELIKVDGKIYETTDKGIDFLNHYEELHKL